MIISLIAAGVIATAITNKVFPEPEPDRIRGSDWFLIVIFTIVGMTWALGGCE